MAPQLVASNSHRCRCDRCLPRHCLAWPGQHPNPHFQRPVLLRDPVTGSDEVVEPASYTCYECGKSWPAVMRDAAWAPTGIRQSYRGYDAALAERASTRAAIVSEQRQLLAANRTGPTRAPAAVAAPKRRGRRKAWAAAANVRTSIPVARHNRGAGLRHIDNCPCQSRCMISPPCQTPCRA